MPLMTVGVPDVIELSVVIPTYNRAPLVWRAVESVLRSGSVPLEVIVVDDGSEDDTERVIASRADDRVRYLRTSHAGVSAARNAGARLASGRYLAFLDSDDEVLPGWADVMMGHLGAGQSIAICGGELIDEQGSLRWSWLPPSTEDPLQQSLAERFLPGMFALETPVFWGAGGYQESLAFGENTELALRLMFMGSHVGVSSERRILVRRHAGTPAASYAEARIESAQFVVEQHTWLRRRLPALWASYHAILGVDRARRGDWRPARRHFFQAVRARPSREHLTRIALSAAPRLASAIWKPNSGNGGIENEASDRDSLRILLVVPEFAPEETGGIASYARDLGVGLRDIGHEVDVLVIRRDQRSEDVDEDGLRVHRRPQLRLLPGSQRQRQLRMLEDASPIQRLAHAVSCRREMRRLPGAFDAVEACEWMAGGLLLGKRTGTGLVVHVHGSARLVERRGSPSLAGRASEWLETVTLRRADLITVPSPAMSEFVEQDVSYQGPIQVVPCPTEVRTSLPEPVPRRPVVLFVGRLDWLKAPEVLVRAGALLRIRVPDLEVIFAGRPNGYRGDTPYGDWLADMARKAESPCRFVGPQSRADVLRLMSSSSVLAVPSRFEAFGLTAAEALGQGTPVVCTDTTGISSLISPPAGIVIPFGDAEAMAEGLQQFLPGGQFATEGAAAALDVARSRLTRRVVAEQKVACYREAMTT